jgi:hypothetical protein
MIPNLLRTVLQNRFEKNLSNNWNHFVGFVFITNNVVVVLCDRGQDVSAILIVDCLFRILPDVMMAVGAIQTWLWLALLLPWQKCVFCITVVKLLRKVDQYEVRVKCVLLIAMFFRSPLQVKVISVLKCPRSVRCWAVLVLMGQLIVDLCLCQHYFH